MYRAGRNAGIGEFSAAPFHPILYLRVYISRVISRPAELVYFDSLGVGRFQDSLRNFFFSIFVEILVRLWDWILPSGSFFEKKRRKLLNALTVGLYGFIRTMCIIFNIPSQEFRVAQSIFRQFVDRFQDFFSIVERDLGSIIELNLSLKRKEESF